MLVLQDADNSISGNCGNSDYINKKEDNEIEGEMMEQKVEIIERETVETLEVNENATMLGLAKIISKTYKEITEYMEEAKAELKEAPYVRYLDLDWSSLDTEGSWSMLIKFFTKKWNMLIGIPVKAKVEGSGKIKPGSLAAGRYVKALHTGPYQKVGSTYKRMRSWMMGNNIDAAGESIEIYLNDPRQTRKEDLQTVVLIPVKEN